MANKIVYFGDSLGDSDEFWRLSQQILVDPLPDPDYYAHQFSNGEVQTDVITRLLAAEGADPASGQDYNYAVGGARAIGPLTAGDFVDDDHVLRDDLDPAVLETRIDLTAQTDRFLAASDAHGWDRSGFAAHMLIGINDLSNWEPDSIWPWQWDDEIDELADDVVASIGTNVQKLLDSGIGEVWVVTQPGETFFPIYNELDDLMRLLADGVIDDLNDDLADLVTGFGDDRVRLLDLEAITKEIEHDPLNFGRVDLENPILLGKGGSYDPELNPDLPPDFDFAADANDYGFLDSVHPTEGTHRVLGAFQAKAMQSNLVSGGDGADRLVGTHGDDLALAGFGDDAVPLWRGNDLAIGGRGSDWILGHGGSDLISGGDGNDVLRGGPGFDLLTGGYGDDRADGAKGMDVIVDAAGSDLSSGGDHRDFILWFDGALNDATQGPDRIHGGAGVDTLVFYLADSATCAAARAEFDAAPGTEFSLPSLGVTVTGMEKVEFLDLSVDSLVLPETRSDTLAARLDEWQHWDFA